MWRGLFGGGGGFIAIIFQCRLTSHGTKRLQPALPSVEKKKEKERESNSMNSRGSMTITQLAVRERVHKVCVVVVG